jgi:hypothetical protein
MIERNSVDQSYFGNTVGSPPGVPGGGITGIAPRFGGGFTLGSAVCGGMITPQDWLRFFASLPDASGHPGGVLGTAGDGPGGCTV